ncbi:WD repeat-containing protein DWA2 [Diplonema papillatum]|nr:WD repeat-containing protein DWA2 [Diplonema papillatum]
MNSRLDPAVYGLELQCRALTAAAHPSEHLFLLGTQCLKGKNQIYLLEYKEDSAFCDCQAMWSHPNEIWSIAACPASSHKDLFWTVHGTPSYERNATLWTKEGGTQKGLGKKTTISNIQLRDVIWDAQGLDPSTVLGVGPTELHWIKVDNDAQVSSSFGAAGTEETRIADAAWDPHHTDVVCLGVGGDLVKVDARQKPVESVIKRAHPTVRCVEYNPNKQYHIASAGDDGAVKFWDIRSPNQSVAVLQAHDHWVTQIKFNPCHEQLLLTASTDRESTVKLWDLPSLASHVSPPHATDMLLRSVSDFDDTVYAVAWSALSPWLFAAVAYNGKVMTHHVPRETKFSILLSN